MSDDLKTHQIPLTKGRVALVSESDYEAISSVKWHAVLCGKRWYARRGITIASGRRGVIYMHRHLLGLGPGDLDVVDHINGDGLDNQRSNIRATTYSQNSLNIQASHGRSGLRCVFLQGGKHVVRIGGEYVGVYETTVEAAYHANLALDRMSPGAGMRNPVDVPALLAILEERRALIDEQISRLVGVGA